MLLLNHSELWQYIFFQEIFPKNIQTIHLYCFSQYRKYLNILIVDVSTVRPIIQSQVIQYLIDLISWYFSAFTYHILLFGTAIHRWYMPPHCRSQQNSNALPKSIILLMNIPAILKWFCIMEMGFISNICQKWHQWQGDIPWTRSRLIAHSDLLIIKYLSNPIISVSVCWFGWTSIETLHHAFL